MTDRRVVVVVVAALALLALAALGGIIFLAATSHAVPDVLQNIAVGAMSALAALLASTKSEPVAVTAPTPLPVVERKAGRATKAAKKDSGHLDTPTGLIIALVGVATLIFVLLIASKVGVW